MRWSRRYRYVILGEKKNMQIYLRCTPSHNHLVVFWLLGLLMTFVSVSQTTDERKKS